jgi:PucR C-terminal helix-turn-helix domain
MTEAGLGRPWARVPEWVGDALRPELGVATDDIIAAVRAEVPDYARPLTGRFGSRITEGVSVALGQFLDLLGRDAALADTRVYRALGQLEHREGRTLAALQNAYQVGCRTLWRRLGAGPTAQRLPPDVVFQLAEALFSYVEQLSAASVSGWAAEDTSRAGSLQTRRLALVELLAGEADVAASDLEKAAAGAAWRVPAQLAALVVEDAVAVAARLPGAIGAAVGPAGTAIVPAVGADWLDRVREALRGRPGVLGPVVGPADAARSVARARAAWPLHTAGRLADAPLARADEHLLTLLLAASPDLTEDLCARALAPLADLPPAAAARAEETLRAWLDAHGDVTAAAAALHVHPQTVRYRLAGLRDPFRLDHPAERLALAVALRIGERLRSGHDGRSPAP